MLLCPRLARKPGNEGSQAPRQVASLHRPCAPPAMPHVHLQLLRRNPVQRISFPEFFTHAFLYPPGTAPPTQEAVRSHSSLGGPPSTSQESSTQESTTIASHSGGSHEVQTFVPSKTPLAKAASLDEAPFLRAMPGFRLAGLRCVLSGHLLGSALAP